MAFPDGSINCCKSGNRSGLFPAPNPQPLNPGFQLLLFGFPGLETAPAAGLVYVTGSYHHALFALDQALRAVCRIATTHTDGQCFCDVFSDGQQLGHRIERAAKIILIQPCNDHTLSHVSQAIAYRDNLLVEELSLIDSDDLSPHIEIVHDFVRGRNHL